jgi:hypothetical protein
MTTSNPQPITTTTTTNNQTPTAHNKEWMFCLYETTGGRMVTSPVIRTLGKWYESSFLIPHECFRQDLIEVDVLFQLHVSNNEAWKITNFFEYYDKRFVPCLHSHHHNEEEIFFPVIKKKVLLPDKTTADHRMLISFIDDLDLLHEEFKKLGGPNTTEEQMNIFFPKLKSKWHEMRLLMGPHFAEEEMHMIGPIKDVFSEKEFDVLIEQVLKREHLAVLRAQLPWIFFTMRRGWANAEEIAKLENNIPAPVRFINKHFWTPAFMKYHRGALESMRKGHEKILLTEKAGKWL